MESQSPWFEGSVGDAVAKTKNENLLFLAFIYDDDENSTKMRELLSDNEISSLMKNNSVAIQIKKGSETFVLFSQIFPTFFCPCLVFIQNGLLVYFLNSEATKEKVIENINKFSNMEQANANNAAPTNQTSSNQASPATNQNSTNPPKKPVSPKPTANVQKEDAEQEKKKERIKELKKLKQDKQSRRKEILEQINNDRKERESRNNSLSGGSGSNSSESLQKLMSQKPKSTNNGDEITMSVRYLDGSLLRQDFKRTQKLSDIRKWVDDTTKDKGIFKPYNLETKYPEHQFTFGEETKTLIELNLDDTDLLICKPATKVFSANPKQTLDIGKYFTANFFKDLMLFFYAFILSLNIFKDPNPPKEGEEEGDDKGANQNYTFKKGKIRVHNNGEKKMGTINDFRNGNDKKTQETYNGNSTNQQ